MEVFFPAYYHSFQCLANRCPDSCCKEWTVDVDPESACYYRQLDGALGDRLRQVLTDTPDGTVMTIESGRCPMWREDGLCRIQAELGHDSLCKTCREFPRLTHDYGDFIELGLELSCPEAARLILSDTGELLMQTQPGDAQPEYDREVMDILRQSRHKALHFMQNAKNIPHALAAILLYAHDVQSAIDSGKSVCASPESCLSEFENYRGNGSMQDVFAFFQTLEILTPQWKQRLEAMPVRVVWCEPMRNLACYLFTRYWLQAISDFDLVCRVKLAIIACLLVGALGGDVIETAQLFSKEIENDPDNVEAVLDGAYTSAALTDSNLLALLTDTF
jgi:lysine-N-methylase